MGLFRRALAACWCPGGLLPGVWPFFVARLLSLAPFGGGFSRLCPPKAGLDRGF